MIRAIVADDEEVSAGLLTDLLSATAKVEVVGTASSGAECLQLVERERPDVVFLDIRMPDIDGLEVAETVIQEEDPPLIVFVTDHDEYAAKAFGLEALDYVVKGIDLEAFEQRVGETVQRLDRAVARKGSSLDALRESLARLSAGNARPGHRKLPVKDYDERTVRLVDPASVIYVQRSGGHAVLQSTEKQFRTHHTIDRLEQRLAGDGFMRANRGALINVNYIDHLIPNGDGSYDAVLGDDGQTVLTISRGRARPFLESLGM